MPPTASKRQQILEYIIGTLLPTITAGASYNYTLATKERGHRSPDRLADNEFPAVFIPTSHEKRSNITGNQYTANPFEVVLVGYVKNSAANPGGTATEVQKDLDKLIADLTKALETDPLLGGLVTNSEITDVVTDEGDKAPIAGCVVKVNYQYTTEGITP